MRKHESRFNSIAKAFPEWMQSQCVDDSEIVALREKLEDSFFEFIKYFFPVFEGTHTFQDGMHIQVIAEHLEECLKGNVRKLVINVPPGFMKTLICSILFPAWAWAKYPYKKFFCLTYSGQLSTEQSADCRRIIRSEEYQKLWGHKFSIRKDADAKRIFANDKGGKRVCSSVNGVVTGVRGDILILDDPNNVKASESDVIREATNNTFDNAITSRVNDRTKYCMIIIQQRVHSRDLTGHILAKDDPDTIHLCLPMEYETGRKCVTIPIKSTNGKRWKDPRTKEHQLLWPERLSITALNKLKDDLNSEYTIAGQLQQRPSPSKGGIIQKDWFQLWKSKELPPCEFVIQSWDTAFTKPRNKAHGANISYSACTTWGVFRDEHNVPNIILLSLFRDKIEYPELRAMAQRLATNYHDTDIDYPMKGRCMPTTILVEAKASGLALIADLQRAGVTVTKFNPSRYNLGGRSDKVARARLVTPLIEAGRVWMQSDYNNPEALGAIEDLFVESAAAFPNEESNDLIDSMSQAFIRLSESGAVGHPLDPQPIAVNTFKYADKSLYDGR